MNLYNIFSEDFNGLMMGVQEDDPIAGANTGLNGVSATLGTENDRSPLTMTEYDEYGLPVTEHNELIDEVAMNPKAFAQAIKTGQDKGVLVGFEFESLIPKVAIERWKNGEDEDPEHSEVPRYNPQDDSWVEGKTVADLIRGIETLARGKFRLTFDHLFKHKGSVKTATGYGDPWSYYQGWAHDKVEEFKASVDISKTTLQALSKILKDPATKRMQVNYRQSHYEQYGDPSSWNGYTFTLRILKDATGLDFSQRVPKSALTTEVVNEIIEACARAYRITSDPYDTVIDRVPEASIHAARDYRRSFDPESGNGAVPEGTVESMIRNFSEFCQEKYGATDLKTLLKTKWAFKGRTNHTSVTLKEQLWYYVTPNAPIPQSLHVRSYGNSNYKDGANYLYEKLKGTFGENMTIFTGYHQATKKLDRWYIEPDGSLKPNGDDSSAEVVSPPLPAAQAMEALHKWYQKARELHLYTNGSTGLHINVSIPDTLDVLKLATFIGDQYILEKFGRENNSYARSVIKSLKGNSKLPMVGSKDFAGAEAEMKSMVKRISDDHFATVNWNGKYVSFRHAGGDYLEQGAEIANTVGRFVRSMIIASDPTAYRQEYVSKLVKMMKAPEKGDGKMTLSDISKITNKGIPVSTMDIVVRPVNPDNPTEADLTNAIAAIRRYGEQSGNGTDVNTLIVPDESARERLLQDRGFASGSKGWIQRAPANMFYHVMLVPTSGKRLERFADVYADGNVERGTAFSLYHNSHKIATAIKEWKLVKRQDPNFAEVVSAMRGGADKPLPLPGTKHAQQSEPATFASQQPRQAQDQETHREYEIYDTDSGHVVQRFRANNADDAQGYYENYIDNYESDEDFSLELRPAQDSRDGDSRDWIVFNPDTTFTQRLDSMDSSEVLERMVELERFMDLPRGTLRVRYADEEPEQTTGTDSEANGDRSDVVPSTWALNNGEIVRHYDSTQVNRGRAFELAREMVRQYGLHTIISHNGTFIGSISPDDSDEQPDYQVVDAMGRLHGTGYDDEEQALASAQELANYRSETVFLMHNGERVRDIRPEVDEDQYGGGFGGGSVAPVTDTTSPIHGYGEDREIDEHIVKVGKKYRLVSRHGDKNLGTYDTKAGAEKRERQVQYFKHVNEDTEPMSQASRELLRVARQSNPEAMNNTDAIYGYLGSIAKKTQDNYKQVNNILRQLDPLNTELDNTTQDLGNVERVNTQQQDLIRRLAQRVNQVQTQALPSQKRAVDIPAKQAAASDEKERQTITKQLDQPQEPKQVQTPAAQEPQQQVQPDLSNYATKDELDKLNARVTTHDMRAKLPGEVQRMVATQANRSAATDDAIDSERALRNLEKVKRGLKTHGHPVTEDEDEIMEARLYAMKRAGYDII